MITIIDYELGNLKSVIGAVKKLGFESIISSDREDIIRASKLILPGVGAFGDGMDNLHKLGIIPALNEQVLHNKKPILGICLGSQLMANDSTEFGYHKGLGWIDANVLKLELSGLRLPHVGWNVLYQVKDDPVFYEIPEDALFYYVHSYHILCRDSSLVIGECEYGKRFTAAYRMDNIYGIQFHPEKSQFFGLKFLNNFLSIGVSDAKKKINSGFNI